MLSTKKGIMLITGLFLISAFSQASSFATENFESSTGKISWKIGKNITAAYSPDCQIDSMASYDDRPWRNKLIIDLDFLSILDSHEKAEFPSPKYERFLVCHQRGLVFFLDNSVRDNFLLFGGSIEVDGKTAIRYKREIYKSPLSVDSKNASVKVSERDVDYYISGNEFITNTQIDLINTPLADKVSRAIALEQIDILNADLFKKYKIVIAYNLLVLIIGLMALFMFKKKVYPLIKSSVKDTINKALILIKGMRVKGGFESGIIKTQSFKAFSVADELIKWSKLRDDGVVTVEEYELARAKLLGREK